MPVAKNIFNLQKNSLLHKWSQVNEIISRLSTYDPAVKERLQKIIAGCEEITELVENDCFQFIQEQLELYLQKVDPILRMLLYLHCIQIAPKFLPCYSSQEKLVHALMNKSFQNDNLCTLFDSLKPNQRLVNVKIKHGLF